MSTVQDYLDLITSEYKDQPKFLSMISQLVAPLVQIQSLILSMEESGGIFDIDTPPVGNQLDIIGQWVGISRVVAIPISGASFTWDGTVATGWDYGSWPDPSNPSTFVTLPDDAYLVLIRAKIAANHWDGTTDGAYAVYKIAFPNLTFLIQDNQNMSYILGIAGEPLSSLTVALITGGYLPLRPEGVLISEYIFPVDTNPLFGWDIESVGVQGWNQGSWGVELAPT